MKLGMACLAALAVAVVFGIAVETGTAAEKGLINLKVDFAPPSGKNNPKPIPETVKKGWWTWVNKGQWDFYRSDLKWENGGGNYPKGGPGIAGSGVHAAMTCHNEGIMTYHVAGMRRYLAGGIQPHNKPKFDPICNSWLAASDFPGNPGSDLLLAFYDLPAGEYKLVSYHNSFNCRRIGDEPTGVDCENAGRPEPPMKAIVAMAVKDVKTNYPGSRHPKEPDKLMVKGKMGSGNVKQTLEAKNVPVQQVKKDSELKPSTIKFTTDGSAVLIVYKSGCCKGDDLRRKRKGGYAALNAFELIQLSQGK
jgi:hypothetical protein